MFFADEIDHAVLLGETARPGASQEVLQRFGPPDPGEWIAHDRFNQIEGAYRNLAVCLHPVPEILPEFRMEYRKARKSRAAGPSSVTRQGQRPVEASRQRSVSPCGSSPG